jgi:uncharacterized damage-inducible protein DinB
MKRIMLSLSAVLFAVPCFAQSPAPAAAIGVGTARGIWEMYANYVLKSAEQMSEADYAFKPVATVRSFGQLIGHVAGSEMMFCAAALGEAPKSEDDIEKTVTTKAGLIAALKASAQYCARAYALTDTQASDKIKMFGADQSKMFALTLNASHVGEHYGNLVTYMRVKGMIPPSSQPQQGGM